MNASPLLSAASQIVTLLFLLAVALDVFTPDEAAKALKVCRSTLQSYLRRGLLKAHRIRGSRLVRITRADLEALLEAREASSK